MQPLFHGSFVALVTPFDEKGRISEEHLVKLVEWHKREGTDGVVCAGTTGEACSLTDQERLTILQICLEAAEQKMSVILGTGTSDTRHTVRLTEQAQKLGADGCLVVTPYYNKPTQRGCVLHYQEVSRVGLPFIVYNNPGRAVVGLQPETIAQISFLPHIAALKQSTSDPLDLRRIRALTALPILAGEDALTFAMLKEGAVGAISVVGNVIPRIWKKMIDLARSNQWDASHLLAARFLPLCESLFRETNPQCVKFALSLLGKCKAVLRLPLVEPTVEVQEEISNVLNELALRGRRLRGENAAQGFVLSRPKSV